METEVRMGEIAVAKGDATLLASGVGSCLVVMLHDRRGRIGGLAHALLPKADSKPLSGDATYVDEAIDKLLDRMEALGAARAGIEARLVGGANMFKAFKTDMGTKNISSAREKLDKAGIAIIGECVGGAQGRSLEFSVASGIVTVKTKF